jgi:WD40 repeat protein
MRSTLLLVGFVSLLLLAGCFGKAPSVDKEREEKDNQGGAKEEGERRAILKSKYPATRAMQFSSDGTLLAAASDAGVLEVWDVASEKVKATFKFGSGQPTIAFSPNNKLIAASGIGNRISIFDLAGGEPRVIKVPGARADKDYVSGVAFSPDSTQLAEAGNDSDTTPRIWDVSTLKPSAAFPIRDRGNFPLCVAFSPDGKFLAAGYNNDQIQVVDIKTGKPRFTPQKDKGTVYRVGFSSDGNVLFVCRPTKGVFRHDAATGKMLGVIAPGEYMMEYALSGDGKLMATPDFSNRRVNLWEVPSGLQKAHVDVQDTPNSVALNPNGKLLAIGRSDGWTWLMNVPVLLKPKQ